MASGQDSISVICGSCSAKLRAPASRAGSRLACPKCGTVIDVPTLAGVAGGAGVEGSLARSAGGRGGNDAKGSSRADRPWVRGPGDWTAWDWIWVKTGAVCVVMGVMAHVLPQFGMQFRKLNNLGAAATTGGTMLAGAGVFLLLYVACLKGRMVRVVVGAAGVGVLAVAGLLALGAVQSARWSAGGATMRAGAVAGSQGPVAGPMAGPMTGPMSGTPGGPVIGPVGGPMSGPRGAMPGGMPGSMDDAGMVARFGEGRVVRVVLVGVEGIDVSATVRRAMEGMEPRRRPGSWRVSHAGDQGRLVMGPWEDLGAIAATLGIGEEAGRDAATRTVTIRVDPSRCVPRTDE